MTRKPLVSKKQIKSYLYSNDFRSLRKLLKDAEPADIAEIFALFDNPSMVTLFRMTHRSIRVAVFSYLELEKQEELMGELPDVLVTSLLNEMEADDRTRLLERLPEEIRHKILLKLNPEARQVAWKLLSYPEESIGRLMTPDVATLNAEMTVAQALEYIHWSKALPIEFLNYLFITDKDGVLLGEVSLAALVVCDPSSLKVKDIMKRNYITLFPEQEENDAVEAFRKYERNYVPVISEEQKLLGIVTSDDVFDLAEDEATEDIQQFGGQGALEDSYFQTPLWTMFKKRTGWLMILFIAGFLSCEALRTYEETIGKWGFLLFFLPIITSAGGNSGTQAASLIIRGLAINEMSSSDVWKVLKKEILIGILLGITLALIGFTRAITWNMGVNVGIIVASSLVSVVMFGVVVGSMLPFVFKRFDFDPAVVSSPFISTLLDVSGIVVYINIALYFMSVLGS